MPRRTRDIIENGELSIPHKDLVKGEVTLMSFDNNLAINLSIVIQMRI